MEIVLVKWEDAFGCPEGWQILDEVERETSLVQSVGFVCAITLPKRQIISIFSCLVPESERNRQGS